MEYKTIESPNKVIDCYFCRRDLRLEDFILCEECQYEICPNCFANGCQSQKHLRTHDYRVIQKLDREIFEPGWSMHQELIFLQSIQMLGYANWEEIAKNIDKKPEEIERHFKYCYENYFEGDLKNNLNLRKQDIFQKTQSQQSMEIEFQPLIQRILNTLEENGTLNKAQSRREKFNPDKKLIFGDILGYMPLRGDFDIEYENEAEILLSEMHFKDNEPDEDLSIKYSILKIYDRRLKERQKRKEFLISRNKLDFEANFAKEKAMSKMERDIRNNLKKYERFQSEEEHEQLVQCLIQEIENKEMVDNLLAIQANNFNTLEDFENNVFNKEEIRNEQKFLNNLPSLRPNVSKRKTAYKFNKNNSLESYLAQKQNSVFSQEELKTMYYEESELCQRLNISYDDYNQIKECLVNESILEYYVNRDQFISKYQYSYDRKIFDEVFDFLKQKDIVLENQEQLIKYSINHFNILIIKWKKSVFKYSTKYSITFSCPKVQYTEKSFLFKVQKNSQIYIFKEKRIKYKKILTGGIIIKTFVSTQNTSGLINFLIFLLYLVCKLKIVVFISSQSQEFSSLVFFRSIDLIIKICTFLLLQLISFNEKEIYCNSKNIFDDLKNINVPKQCNKLVVNNFCRQFQKIDHLNYTTLNVVAIKLKKEPIFSFYLFDVLISANTQIKKFKTLLNYKSQLNFQMEQQPNAEEFEDSDDFEEFEEAEVNEPQSTYQNIIENFLQKNNLQLQQKPINEQRIKFYQKIKEQQEPQYELQFTQIENLNRTLNDIGFQKNRKRF